jgi:uncharacterized protein YecE (DUF72 family)
VTVKASRFLTHVKRLRDPQEPVGRLMERVAGLGRKLGAVLLQLPPTLQRDAELLDACLGCFPAGTRVAVEPRHPSWWDPSTREVLERRAAALVWADSFGRAVTPLWRTTDWGYLRLHHGPGETWDYGPDGLRHWAAQLSATWDDHEDVYAYTNNDPTGAALRDAVTLGRLLREQGRAVGRLPDLSTVSTPPGPPAS